MKQQEEIKKEEVAIRIENISKTFRIPHEKISSLKGAAISAFKKKTYEEFKALDDVSFEVKKGEFFGIIGRNGSGKSTLLKILAGIYQADKGKVEINGMISPFLELGIGFNPELSGRDNVYLNATVLGLTKKEIDEKFDSIVKFSELERFIDQKLKNYSSGMQVRLAFSVSIHANRDILLMDEVLAVGDSNFQSKCLTEFNKYRDMGRTVIIVTHDIAVVERYCNRAMLLRNGKIVKIGKSDEVAGEYIQSNIRDERRHLLHFNKNNKGKLSSIKENFDTGEKNIEIINIELFDKENNIKNIFDTGESFYIKVNFRIYNHVDIFNIGIGMYSSDKDERIFTYDTRMDKYSVNGKNNYIILSLKELNLLSGNFYLNAICFGETEQVYYDIKRKIKKFKIAFDNSKSTSKYKGLFYIEHNWNQ